MKIETLLTVVVVDGEVKITYEPGQVQILIDLGPDDFRVTSLKVAQHTHMSPWPMIQFMMVCPNRIFGQ